jgi:hypothetical protein
LQWQPIGKIRDDDLLESEMSASPIEPERLHARKVPLRKRLWVRVISILLLISIISFTSVWWPRRTMLSVWFANGRIFCESRKKPSIDLMVSLGIMQTVWGSKNWMDHYALLSGTGLDRDVTAVILEDSSVKDDWLIYVKHLPALTYLGLHDRQLGTGLDALRDMIELQRLPNLETLDLWSPEDGDIGLDTLSSLPKLKTLLIDHCGHTDQILKSLDELPGIEQLIFQNCTGFADEDLVHLQRLTNLKYLDLVRCGPINDEGLQQLSQLKNLETLCIRKSSGRFTDEGLDALKDLPNLKEIIVIRGDFTAEQLKKMEELLPNVLIRVN